jgi:hypothetical protein
MTSAAAAADAGARSRGLFFALLVAATDAPYLLFPLAALAPERPGLRQLPAILLFFGAGAHVVASFFFYTDARVRAFMNDGREARYLFVPIALVLLSLLWFAFGGDLARAYGLIAFWIWQVHHFTRQNHGILAFASRAYALPVAPAERLAITLTDVAAVLATIPFVTPWRLTVLDVWGWHIHAVGLGVYACAWAVYLFSRRGRLAPQREIVLLALMAFYLPLFLFRDAFSAVYIYLTAHGLQYFVFMLYVAGTPRATRARAFAALATLALLGGALMKFLHEPAAHGFALYGIALGITMWHFVLDAGVWRLSEPFPRAYMLERFGFLRGGAQAS